MLQDDNKFRDYERFMRDYDDDAAERIAGCLSLLFAVGLAIFICGMLTLICA